MTTATKEKKSTNKKPKNNSSAKPKEVLVSKDAILAALTNVPNSFKKVQVALFADNDKIPTMLVDVKEPSVAIRNEYENKLGDRVSIDDTGTVIPNEDFEKNTAYKSINLLINCVYIAGTTELLFDETSTELIKALPANEFNKLTTAIRSFENVSTLSKEVEKK